MDRKIILDFDKKEKSRKHKSSRKGAASTGAGGSSNIKKSKTQHHKQEAPDETEASSSQYRDRARERREGLQKDFELDPDNFIISNPTVDGEQAIDEAERRRQQIEESKYLGGDAEHTHLVMGLDFALAEKIRATEKLSAEKEGKQEEHELDFLLGAADRDEEEFLREALQAGSVTSSGKRQIDIGKLRTSEMISCRTALARRILNVLDERWPEKSEMFVPGRMSYVMPLDEDSDGTVTTILRSKAEQQESETSTEKDLAFDQLINILAKIRKQK